MQFQANRASGGAWFTTVRTTLQRLHDRQALESFGVTVSMSAPPLLPQDPDASEQWFLGECKMIEKYWRVLIEISSARSWSQIQLAPASRIRWQSFSWRTGQLPRRAWM